MIIIKRTFIGGKLNGKGEVKWMGGGDSGKLLEVCAGTEANGGNKWDGGRRRRFLKEEGGGRAKQTSGRTRKTRRYTQRWGRPVGKLGNSLVRGNWKACEKGGKGWKRKCAAKKNFFQTSPKLR